MGYISYVTVTFLRRLLLALHWCLKPSVSRIIRYPGHLLPKSPAHQTTCNPIHMYSNLFVFVSQTSPFILLFTRNQYHAYPKLPTPPFHPRVSPTHTLTTTPVPNHPRPLRKLRARPHNRFLPVVQILRNPRPTHLLRPRLRHRPRSRLHNRHPGHLCLRTTLDHHIHAHHRPKASSASQQHADK